WVRDTLPWKSHQPLVFDKQVEHYCDGCHITRYRGLRLWWKSPASVSGEGQADSYLCNSCYTTKKKWSAVMPEGYEDVETFKSLVARKKQLQGAVLENDMLMDDAISRRKRMLARCYRAWKEELKCTSCDRARIRAFKVWWKSPTGSHICHYCYTKPDWSEIMPKGFEDARLYSDLVARKKDSSLYSSGSPDRRRTSYATLRSDPEAWRAHLDMIAASKKKRHDEDSEYRRHARQLAKLRHEQMKNDPAYLTRNLIIPYYCNTHGLARGFLGSFIVLFGCEITRRGGFKIWWRKANQTAEDFKTKPEFLCHICFNRQDDWTCATPEGYEDVKTLEEVLARKQQLVGLDEGERLGPTGLYRQTVKFEGWCRHEWFRELPWKTHRPSWTEERVEDHCARCEYSRHRALKLWWRSS
ncbi:unnamed protein product, partial [Aureobasidium vineae]